MLPTLPNARFWVRPYEFEGDGSTGAAQAMETVNVGGRERTFWLKELEDRLFFREVGRGEEWNFGSLESAKLEDFARILEDGTVWARDFADGCVASVSFARRGE